MKKLLLTTVGLMVIGGPAFAQKDISWFVVNDSGRCGLMAKEAVLSNVPNMTSPDKLMDLLRLTGMSFVVKEVRSPQGELLAEQIGPENDLLTFYTSDAACQLSRTRDKHR
jgi:hypothetical protein